MQIGSLAWADATNGALRAGERASLVGPLLRTAIAHGAGRARLALGLRGDGGVDLAALKIPDSRLVQLADEEARDTISECMIQHSRRTFLFGLALAACDGLAVDVEHFYATSLLHDIALETPDAACCFAVRGGRTMRDVARRAGCDDATTALLADAIAMHITPGVGFERGPLAPLIQAGAMVDLMGQRLWDLRAAFVADVVARHPRLGMKRHLSACWLREAATFPSGRAAFIERFGFFSRFVGWAPYAE